MTYKKQYKSPKNVDFFQSKNILEGCIKIYIFKCFFIKYICTDQFAFLTNIDFFQSKKSCFKIYIFKMFFIKSNFSEWRLFYSKSI